jgi:PIN domain nuclease of toxin-antitoxin system
VKLLLDTHIALWAITDDLKLPKKAADLIEDQSNELFVSTGSLWEIAIKYAVGRGSMPISAKEALGYFLGASFQMLDITTAHALGVEALPPLHADPFDRILIAQALSEPLRLLTHDKMVARYSDSIISV